jgi:hypothetical protein
MSINPYVDSKGHRLHLGRTGKDHGFRAEIIRPEFEFVPPQAGYSNFEFEPKIQIFLGRVVCQDIREVFSKRMSGITVEFLGLDRFGKRFSEAGYNPTRKLRKRLFAAAKGGVCG